MEQLKFWGIRGSYPMCGREYVEYGGNTTCISLELGGKLIILDAGTGIINLSKELYDKYDEYHLFISHTHIDHLQGLPFFKAIYNPKKSVYIYGRGRGEKTIEDLLKGFITRDYFPVPFENLVGIKKIIEIGNKIDMGGGVKVEVLWIDKHPIYGVLLYKILYKEKSIVFATDIECSHEYDPLLIKFIEDVDILLHDSTYTEDNYENHRGWGHSTVEVAIKNSKLANVKKLYLIHYDTHDTDKMLSDKFDKIISSHSNVFMPKEGDIILL